MEAFIGDQATPSQNQSLENQIIPWIEIASAFVNAAIVAICLALMTSFWFAKITPIFLLIFGMPLMGLIFYGILYKGKLIQKPCTIAGRSWIYLLILGILISGGLYLRYPTSAHIHGGQDQGSYFNIAAWIAHHGTYERHDRLLSDAFRNKWPFAFNLIWNPYKNQGKPQKDIPGEYEGERFVGGFTVKSREKGVVVPQFYPLTPLLLAVGHWMFGGKHTSDILPIFGILSVISSGLLAYRMFKNRLVAVLVFVTLLFSGLEVFFSTFPVSEMISQYFLMTGMWFVLRSLEEEAFSFPLMAGLNFTVAFFNHETSIFYLVPVIIFLLTYRMASERRMEGAQLLIFYYTFLAGLTLSLVSARIHNGYYVFRNLTENLNFLETFSINDIFLILFAAVLVAAGIPFVLSTRPGRWLQTKSHWVKWTMFSAVITLIMLVGVKTALFKLHLISSAESDYTYFSSITAHLSLIGWVLLLWGIFYAIQSGAVRSILLPLLVFLWFSFLFLFLAFLTEYQWYFDRYYVKEIYPLAIIFISYGIYLFSRLRCFEGIPGKALSCILGFLLILYSAHPVLYNFKKPFLQGAYDAMVNLDSRIKDGATIILVPGRDSFAPPDSELRLSVPLVYSFNHDVIWLPLQRELPKLTQILTSYLRPYKKPLYLLYVGAQPLPHNLLPPGSKYITSQVHEFTEPERVNAIPKKLWHVEMGLHLYEL